MNGSGLADELVTDLLRSAWIVEAARARVFSRWARRGDGWRSLAALAQQRADVVAANLEARGRSPDDNLVAAHASWMTTCVPRPDEPFAGLFMARLGGWVDAHAAGYLERDARLVTELGERERATVTLPTVMPPLPPPRSLGPEPEVRSPSVRLRVGVLGDLHAGSERAHALAVAAIADLNAARPDIVVQLGDLTDRGDAEEFAAAADLLTRLDAPFEVVMGNHDAYSYADEALTGRSRFEALAGRPPEGLLREAAGIRLLLLDSVEHEVSPFPPYDLLSGAFGPGRGGAIVRGTLTPAQHDLLAEVATTDAPPALVFLHHPPQPFTGFPPVIFGLNDVDSGRLHATCDSGNVWGVFAGHTHRNHRGPGFDGVAVVEVAAPRDYPFGFGLIDISASGYRYRFHQISARSLVKSSAAGVSMIQRRYGAGRRHDRAVDWSRPVG